MLIRKYYIDLVEGRRRGPLAFGIKMFLFPLSLLYGLIINLRNYLYDKKFLKSKVFKIPVISIGNLTWGGTGKTSLVIKLVLALAEFKIAVLSRGYGQDEISLIRGHLRDTSSQLFVGKDRLKLLEKLDSCYDLVLLDDGFQYRRIKKDLEIVLVNGKDSIGKNFFIPLGKLREPPKSLRRADVVIIMHSLNRKIEAFLKKINPQLEVFFGRYLSLGLRDLQGIGYSKEEFLNREFACFTAIGWPQSFLDSLEELGLSPKLKFIYPDHYELKEEEFRKIEQRCLSLNIRDLIITSKDRERFCFSTSLSIFILEVDLEIENYQKLLELIKQRVKKRNHS